MIVISAGRGWDIRCIWTSICTIIKALLSIYQRVNSVLLIMIMHIIYLCYHVHSAQMHQSGPKQMASGTALSALVFLGSESNHSISNYEWTQWGQYWHKLLIALQSPAMPIACRALFLHVLVWHTSPSGPICPICIFGHMGRHCCDHAPRQLAPIRSQQRSDTSSVRPFVHRAIWIMYSPVDLWRIEPYNLSLCEIISKKIWSIWLRNEILMFKMRVSYNFPQIKYSTVM